MSGSQRLGRGGLSSILWCGIASAALYQFLGFAFPMSGYAERRRLYDLMLLTGHSAWGALTYASIVILLFVLYWWMARILLRRPHDGGGARWPLLVICGFGLLFAGELLGMYPINAADMFGYFFRSRIFVFYRGNPLIDAPHQFPGDPYLYTVGQYVNMASPYGPVWELLAGAAALLTRGELLPNLLALKGVSALSYGGSVLLVSRILRRIAPAQQTSGTLLFAWNPLILLEWVGNGHNDAVMVFWVLLGVWLWAERQYVWVVPAFVVAAYVKAIAAIAIPLFALDMWFAESSGLERLHWLLKTLLLAGAISLVVFAPFGIPRQYIAEVLNEAKSRVGFSFAVAVDLALQQQVLPVLERTLRLSEGTMSTLSRYATIVSRWLSLGGLAALYLRQLGMVWRRKRDPIVASAEAFYACVLLAPIYRMWYPAWPMTLATLRPNRDRLIRAEAACLSAELSVLVYGFAVRWRDLPRLLLGTTLTLLVPTLVPLVDRWMRRLRWWPGQEQKL